MAKAQEKEKIQKGEHGIWGHFYLGRVCWPGKGILRSSHSFESLIKLGEQKMESECHQECWLCLVTPSLEWEDDKQELNRTYRINHSQQHSLGTQTGWISLQSRNSQGSFSAPQFKHINSSAFSLHYGLSKGKNKRIRFRTPGCCI